MVERHPRAAGCRGRAGRLEDRGTRPDRRIARRSSPRRSATGATDVGCIILGRGENEQKVVEWLSTAAAVPGFIGFAVGRTSFWEPLVAWRDGRKSAEEAAAQIASRYREWVDIFEKARTAASLIGAGDAR